MSLSRNIRFAFLLLAVLLLALVAGCGSSDQDINLTGQLMAPASGPPTGDGKLSARISLIAGTSDNGERIVAERTLHDVGQFPIQFKLKVARDLLQQGTNYGLSAQIVDANGNTVLISGKPHPVAVFKKPAPAQLTMTPNRGSSDGSFVQFDCAGGFNFELAHNAHGASVLLGNRQIRMQRAPSVQAGSIRYTDDHKDEVVMGNGITSIYFDGVSHHACRPKPKKTTGDDHASASGQTLTSTGGSSTS